MMTRAKLKKYDSIAITSPREYERYVMTGNMPRSIELQVFDPTNVRVIRRLVASRYIKLELAWSR